MYTASLIYNLNTKHKQKQTNYTSPPKKTQNDPKTIVAGIAIETKSGIMEF